MFDCIASGVPCKSTYVNDYVSILILAYNFLFWQHNVISPGEAAERPRRGPERAVPGGLTWHLGYPLYIQNQPEGIEAPKGA